MKVTLPALNHKGIQLLAAAYAASILFILPLYADNGLIQLVRSKGRMFLFSTCITAVCAMILAAYHYLYQRQKLRSFFRFPSKTGLSLLFLLLSYSISTLLSHNPVLSFFGLQSRMNGWLMLASCSLCYFLIFCFVSSHHIPLLLNGMLFGIMLASLVAWLNLFCMDPLGYYSYIEPSIRHQFISTVGNINFFGALLCLAAPYALYQALFSARYALWYKFCAVFFLSSFLVANSDGPWLSLVLSCFIVLCSKRITSIQAKTFFSIMCCCFGVWLLAGILIKIFPIYAPMRTISEFLCRPSVSLLGIALCLLAFFLFDKKHLSAQRFFKACFWLMLSCCIIFTILCNVAHISLGPLDGLFQFGPQWGSNRGYVWGRLLYRYFFHFSWCEKLFGIGPDMVDALLNPVYTDYIISINGTTFDSAHNEFLQMLICGGAVGLLFWGYFIIRHIRRSLHTAPYLTASLSAYCIQSFFSIHFPGILPLFFVLCAFAAVGKRSF